jgi:hypothetical protein
LPVHPAAPKKNLSALFVLAGNMQILLYKILLNILMEIAKTCAKLP